MCPITQMPCSKDCRWNTFLFKGKDGKEYYGCILEKIEMQLDSIDGNTLSIDSNTTGL